MLKEFKDFALKGNVVDMAVGIIIGTAFSAIVKSLVADVILPIVGIFTGGIDFSNLKYVLSPAVVVDGVETVAENAIRYGAFIQSIFDFLLLALCIFVAIKQINKLKKPKEVVEEVATGPSQEDLLTEIRDLLAKK